MKIIKVGKDLWHWMVKYLDYLLPEFVTDHSFAVMRQGEIVAAFCYHERGINHWEVTICAKNPLWCCKSVVKYILDYPFKVLRAHRLSAQCLAGNKAAAKLVEGVGFTREGVLRQYFNGADVISYSMLRGENGRYS